jgi:phage gpG-like protein
VEIIAQVVGAETLIASLKETAAGYSKRVPATVRALGLQLLANVKENYLTGQSLNVRTGRLRRSINEKFTENGTTFTSSVGTNVSYGRFWELGFHGIEEVKAHTRMMTMAWGRAVKEPREISVGAHQRELDQKARPFLQPALAAMKDEIRARLVGSIEGRA